jgi:hypothetical protein
MINFGAFALGGFGIGNQFADGGGGHLLAAVTYFEHNAKIRDGRN